MQSALAVATFGPYSESELPACGWKAADTTRSEWPTRSAVRAHSGMRHTRALPAQPAVTKSESSGLRQPRATHRSSANCATFSS